MLSHTLLGTDVSRHVTLDLDELIAPSDSLDDLEVPFEEAKIWDAIKLLPAQGPPDSMVSLPSSSAPAGRQSSTTLSRPFSSYTHFSGEGSIGLTKCS